MQLAQHWKIFPLGEAITSVANGLNVPQDKSGIGSPITRIETIASDRIDATRVGYVRAVSPEELAKFRLQPGDILFSHINSEPQIGRAVVYGGIPEELLHGINLLRLRVNPALVNPYFLAFVLKYYREQGVFVGLASRAVGQSSINQGKLKLLDVPVPSLEEQVAIVWALDAVQKTKETRQRELALERERKAALMEYLFTRGTRGEPTKQTEIGEIPESWQLSPLGDIAQITSGGTPDRTRPEYWNGGIPWVKTGEIRYNTIRQTDETISQAGLENSAARIIPAGTLLMAMYGQGITRGKVAILGIEAALNQACAAILLSDKVINRFALFYLQFAYERIRNLGHGANQKNLNGQLVGSIQIPVPTQEEQDAICRPLMALDAKLDSLERECSLLDELFRALLEQLMTGRL